MHPTSLKVLRMASVEGKFYSDQNQPVSNNTPIENNFKAGGKSHTVKSHFARAGREDHVAQSVFDSQRSSQSKPASHDYTASCHQDQQATTAENIDEARTPILPRKRQGPPAYAAPQPPKKDTFETMDTPPISRKKRPTTEDLNTMDTPPLPRRGASKKDTFETMDTPPLPRKVLSPQEKYEKQWKADGRWQESDEAVWEVLSDPSQKEYAVLQDPDDNGSYYLAVKKDGDVCYVTYPKSDFINHVSAYKTEQKISQFIRSLIPYSVTATDLDKIAKGQTIVDRLEITHGIQEIEKGISNSELTSEDALEILAKIVDKDPGDKNAVKKDAKKATLLTNTDHDKTRNPALDTLLRALINAI